MASGRLAAVNPTSLTQTTVYTVPAANFTVLTINVYNQGSSSTTVDLSVVDTSSTAPALKDYIERATVLPPGAQIERTGIVLSAGQTIKVYVSGASVAVASWGIETEV